MIALIACIDNNNGIGKDGNIPWSLPPDMKHFKELTINSIIIMGRITWQSIGSTSLPKRVNIVVTSKPETINKAVAFVSLSEALSFASSLFKPIFIIGGSRLYEYGLPLVDRIYITRLKQSYECDVSFPSDSLEIFKCDTSEWLIHEDIEYRYEVYDR